MFTGHFLQKGNNNNPNPQWNIDIGNVGLKYILQILLQQVSQLDSVLSRLYCVQEMCWTHAFTNTSQAWDIVLHHLPWMQEMSSILQQEMLGNVIYTTVGNVMKSHLYYSRKCHENLIYTTIGNVMKSDLYNNRKCHKI